MKLSNKVLRSLGGNKGRNTGIVCLSFVLMAIASIAGAIWGHFQKCTDQPQPTEVLTTQQALPNAIFNEPCPACGMG